MTATAQASGASGSVHTIAKPKALIAVTRQALVMVPVRASPKFYRMTAGLLLITQAVTPMTQTTTENWRLGNRGLSLKTAAEYRAMAEDFQVGE
jgi:hypothetical protein